MHSIDVAYHITDGVVWSVCWSVGYDVRPTKTSELIDMLFGVWSFEAKGTVY